MEHRQYLNNNGCGFSKIYKRDESFDSEVIIQKKTKKKKQTKHCI